MTKEKAVEYMIKQIEEIERERLADNLTIDPNKQKKEATDKINKVLKELEVEYEN